MEKFKIIDWAGNDVNTGEKPFEDFEDGWAWIIEHIPNEDDHCEYAVISAEEAD